MLPVDPPRRRRWFAVVVLTMAVLVAACGGDGGDASDDRVEQSEPNRTPPPTLAGGIDLPAVDPVRLLVGAALAYGQPLPSQQVAADAYLEDPEIASVIARRVHSRNDGRLLAEALVLELVGKEMFDESVLEAFVDGAVGALGDGTTEPVTMEGRPVLRSRGASGTVLGFREGNQLVLMRGADQADVERAVQVQLQAYAAGATGSAEPFTPLLPRPIDAAFVAVPTVEFQPIPPSEEEVPPEPPGFPGTTAVQGRYGVVAGERRTTVWAYTLDRGTYPSAETLEPKLAEVVSARAGGAKTETTEVLGRVVLAANGPEGSPSVRAFRDGGLVLIVEGAKSDQLDAVITAWLTELS